MSTPNPPAASEQRFFEVDLLKAVAIVTVVLIHVLRAPWDPGITQLEVWLGSITRFAVPCFLFASGFLYATSSAVGLDKTLRRLRRIGIPYLIASAGAQLFRIARDEPSVTGAIWSDFLLAASFGPYYYVLQIFLLVLATPLFARLGPRTLVGWTAAMVLVQLAFDQGWLAPLSFQWYLRNPLVWCSYFLLGWVARSHWARLSGAIEAVRWRLLAGSILFVTALAAIIGVGSTGPGERFAVWLLTYAMLPLLLVAASAPREAIASVRWLSDASYAIYLFHLFFVLTLVDALRGAPGELSVLALAGPWAGGLLGSALLVWIARALLGERSRDVVGA